MSRAKNLHIVLIEDELTLLHLYQMALGSLGQVDAVSTKEDAITLLDSLIAENKVPDIILLDLIIPENKRAVINFTGRPGFDVLEYIRKTKSLQKLPVMVMTNLDSAEDRDRAKALSVAHYIVKSNVVPKEIVARIREIV